MDSSKFSTFHASAREKFLALSLESTRKSYYPQLKEQLENLKRNEARLKLLIDNLPALIAYVNAKEEFVLINRSFERALGESRAQIAGRKIIEIVGPKAYSRLQSGLENVLAGISARFEFYPERIDLKGKCFEINLVPEKESSGQVNGFYIMAIDLTQKKEAEKEKFQLEKSLHQAQKMEALGTLSGGIAHDFNNILSGIFGYSQLIDLRVNKPDQVRVLNKKIFEGARRASDLIQQILTFSRKTEFNRQPLSFSAILKEALKLLRSTIPTTIQIKEQIESSAMILADATQVHQVIMNLSTNAYHAMAEKGGVLTVGLKDAVLTDLQLQKYGQNGPFICLEISDTGPGIEDEVRNRIFDPYFTTKAMGKGTGLGLAIVDGIVKKHNGFIELTTAQGQGTCFDIFFPVHKARRRTSPGAGTRKTDTPFPKGQGNILLVDDEPGIRETFSGLLTFQGYTVTAFDSGGPALDAFARDPSAFDLVITDMTMPGITGVQLAKEILAFRKDLPIIICTGFHENFSKDQAARAGIARYLEKPVTSAELLDTIRQLLSP